MGFISDEVIYNHVKDTVLKYQRRIDLEKFNSNLIDPIKLTFDAKVYGKTFEENALIKARSIAKLAPGALVLADDSGLEVDYLDRAPGVLSARFMGEDTDYTIKNNKCR